MAAADIPETTVHRSLPLSPSRFSGPISGEDYQFTAAYAKDAKWARGLREFFENRKLGVQVATGGQFKAHVLRVRTEENGKRADASGLHTTGLHTHALGFQMIYILKGWIRFVYHVENDGNTRVEEHLFGPGDCCLQPPAILHNELECSEDLELLEVTSPAHYETQAATQK